MFTIFLFYNLYISGTKGYKLLFMSVYNFAQLLCYVSSLFVGTTIRTQKDPNQNYVKIIDRSYLDKSFKAKLKAAQSQIDGVVKGFQLKTDQERAFRIVANHAVSPNPEQLKMYMGGMGGSGKSPVIKALMYFFKLRNESHCLAVLASLELQLLCSMGQLIIHFWVWLLMAME